jgi:KDO2-lipid IV(A) lauroyltransferase
MDEEATQTRPKAHERVFWRRLALLGATRGPRWWVRYSPPVFGWAAAALVPSARRAVRRNLHRIRGDVDPLQDTREVLATFATYASCFTEVLTNEAPGGPPPASARIHGELWVRRALAEQKGVILCTVHSAGWESAGPLLAKHLKLRIVLVMEPEPDVRARELQDHARELAGVRVVHVGDDPLASIPLLHHLKDGGVVALQVDRGGPGMRMRRVRLLEMDGEMPEGPLRLAQASGAPLLPVFCARMGHREYLIEAHPALHVARHATDADLDATAQALADRVGSFLRAHPTQWFNFK